MTRKNADTTDKIIIKKYANRRLYNTDSSSYVTLEHLAVLVKENRDFIVVDAKSGEDITRSVLAQIIFDKESKDSEEDNMLPIAFLKQLISLYGDGIQQLVPTYLQTSLEAFMDNQQKLREQFAAQSPIQLFEDLTRQNLAFMQEGMKLFTPNLAPQDTQSPETQAEQPSNTAQAAASDQVESHSAQIKDLQSQLTALQNQISKLDK